MSDNTAAERQQKRSKRLIEQGYKRKTIWIHEKCEAAFNVVKEHLQDPQANESLEEIIQELQKEKKPVNIASVRQLSPFRYPGGKTWLIPELKKRLYGNYTKPKFFIEPFAGGGIASLTVAAENLTDQVIMGELDPDVSSVWKTILRNPEYLCDKIKSFVVNYENVRSELDKKPSTTSERAFQTIIKNRVNRGGILAPGAGLVKTGENGKGLKSRWYPETLVKRIKAINQIKNKIKFYEMDAFELIKKYKENKDTCFFIDPPYTLGKKGAGKRLYRHNEIDHRILFKEMSEAKGKCMLTYDDTTEAENIALEYGFNIDRIPMKNTHNRVVYELIICN
ncbi:MAG: DNA adenine methylase [Balneolales bacterium]